RLRLARRSRKNPMTAPPAAPVTAALVIPLDASDSPTVGSLRKNAAPAPIPPPMTAHRTRRFMAPGVPSAAGCQPGRGAAGARLARRFGARDQRRVHLLEHDLAGDHAL